MHRGDARWDPAFEEFVAASSAALLRTGYLLSGDRVAAEDLVQHTLMRTAGHWVRAQQAPEAYARRVLVNLSRDQHRRAARTNAASALGLPGAGRAADARDLADVLAERDQVIEALGRLSVEHREVLVLRFYADLSVAETAAVIGESEGTAKSRTSRALTRMRALLADLQPEHHQRASSEVADEQR
jgi:RNA polymerase sigma-70 factor (sigma-E family)